MSKAFSSDVGQNSSLASYATVYSAVNRYLAALLQKFTSNTPAPYLGAASPSSVLCQWNWDETFTSCVFWTNETGLKHQPHMRLWPGKGFNWKHLNQTFCFCLWFRIMNKMLVIAFKTWQLKSTENGLQTDEHWALQLKTQEECWHLGCWTSITVR